MVGRDLTTKERSILELLLSQNFEDVETFRSQIPVARVTEAWVPGLPSTKFDVPASAPRSGYRSNICPYQGIVHLPDAEETPGFLLLWFDKGAISSLEYAWTSDTAPSDLPDPSWIELKEVAPYWGDSPGQET
jgi:hypothetical protein